MIDRGEQYVFASGPDDFLPFLKKDGVYQDRLMNDVGLKGK